MRKAVGNLTRRVNLHQDAASTPLRDVLTHQELDLTLCYENPFLNKIIAID